jgi:hypothetical protein
MSSTVYYFLTFLEKSRIRLVGRSMVCYFLTVLEKSRTRLVGRSIGFLMMYKIHPQANYILNILTLFLFNSCLNIHIRLSNLVTYFYKLT